MKILEVALIGASIGAVGIFFAALILYTIFN